MKYKPFEKERYEAFIKQNSHAGNPKPSFEEREKLLAEYQYNAMTKAEKINHNLKRELGVENAG